MGEAPAQRESISGSAHRPAVGWAREVGWTMEFQDTNLGSRRGETVEVTIKGTGPNVLLMNGTNFSAFNAGRQARYCGGSARRSPVQLPIPGSAHWYPVIHYGGLREQC